MLKLQFYFKIAFACVKEKKKNNLFFLSFFLYFSNAIYQETELVFWENIAVSIRPENYLWMAVNPLVTGSICM